MDAKLQSQTTNLLLAQRWTRRPLTAKGYLPINRLEGHPPIPSHSHTYCLHPCALIPPPSPAVSKKGDKMTDHQHTRPAPTPRMMTFGKAIEILTDLRDASYPPRSTDLRDALTIALFLMRLLEKGDLTYEPLP